MKLLIDFDLYTVLVDAPQEIVEKREYYRKKFLNSIYGKESRLRPLKKKASQSGQGVTYTGKTFVDWLNAKALKKGDIPVQIVDPNVNNIAEFLNEGVPLIFF